MLVCSLAPGVVGAVAVVGKRALIAGFLGSSGSSFGSSVPMGSGPVAALPGQRNSGSQGPVVSVKAQLPASCEVAAAGIPVVVQASSNPKFWGEALFLSAAAA